MSKKDELQCLMSTPNLGEYVGRWIAVIEDEIVAVGNRGVEVFQTARERYPEKTPMIMKVPEDKVMLL